MKDKGKIKKRRIEIDLQLLAGGRLMAKTLCSLREFSLGDLKHHHCISSGMQVMKPRSGNVRPTTQDPNMLYRESLLYSLICMQ